MNQQYDKIMSLYGAMEIKHLVKKWDVLSDNLKDTRTKSGIILPDLLWVMNSGVGRTRILNLFAEYLYSRKNLVDFYGDTKCFEFLLNYCPPEQPFGEMQRFMETVQNAAGFRSEFRGVVCVDINEWIEHCKEKHFVSFLELLACHREDWLIVLSVPQGDEKKIQSLHSYLSSYLRLERVNIEMPGNMQMLDYVRMKLMAHGLLLTDKEMHKLRPTINILEKSKIFDGFKTLDMLCQDIAYEHFCQSDARQAIIGEDVVAKFMEDSAYVKKFTNATEKTHGIGFVLEDK